MSELETEYFLITLRMARSGTQELRRYLERLRQEIFQKQIELEGRINSSKTNHLTELNMYYCSSWIPAAIHVATSCNKFQTVQALMDKFGLKQDVVEMHLHQLEKYRLVQQQDNHWIFSGGSIHFSKNSEMDQTFQINRRVQAISKISVRKQTNIHYANLFTVDHTTALEIRKILLSTLEKVHTQVEPAPSEDVYGICLDFFEA